MKYAFVAAAVFAGDFYQKKHMEEREFQEGKELLWGRVVLKKYHNKGAAMNFLEKKPATVKRACGALLLVLGIFWWILLRRKANPCILLGLSLVLGGGANNFYDRVKRGYVVDYFSFGFGGKRFSRIVFNLSDFGIIIGAMMAALAGTRP